MRSIWRAEIEIEDHQYLDAPGLTRVLSVEDRRGYPEVWYTVDTSKPVQSVRLWVLGTGHPIPDECLELGHYVGHFLAVNGAFVGHVYASSNDGGGHE